MSEHLRFTKVPDEPGRKTSNWRVEARSGDLLGRVGWWNGWRRYVFHPTNANVLFDAECLQSIADFCRRATDDRKEARARERAPRPKG